MSEDMESGQPICETQIWVESMSEARRETLIVAVILFVMIALFWRAAFHIGVLNSPSESLVNFLILLALFLGSSLLVRMFIRSHLGTGVIGRSLRITNTHPWYEGDGKDQSAVGFLEENGVRWLEKGERLEMQAKGLFGEFVFRIRNGSETIAIKPPRWSSPRLARLAVSTLNAAAAVSDAELLSGEDPSLIGARQRESSGESLLERSWDSTTPGIISDDVRSGIQQILDSRGSESIRGESE